MKMKNSRSSHRLTLVVATATTAAMMIVVATINPASAFTPTAISSSKATATSSSPSPTSLHYKHNKDDCNNQFDKEDCDILKERLNLLKVNVLEEELKRPPNNPNLQPQELVKAIMDGLLYSYDPLPDSGFRMLLHASTKSWRYKILQSIGVPMKKKMQEAEEISSSNMMNIDLIASALGEAMGRPENQFAILVGEEEEYVLDFPSDPLEYETDGTCWVECKLRNKSDGKLLVITGWELKRQSTNNDNDNGGSSGQGPWLVDNIMWQDFRDKYRPGIGREEWTRICR